MGLELRQHDFFAAAPSTPEGFVQRDNALSAAEEKSLVAQFASLPFTPFEFHGFLGKRRIVSFGYRYDYGMRRLRDSAPMPDFLMDLRSAAAAFAQVSAGDLTQALVTEYAPGAGIGWHRDKPMFRDVVAFSFLAACTLRLRRKQDGGWERHNRALPPRSAYILSGPARWEWEHSIPEVSQLRYSVTFRNFVAAAP